MVQATRLDSPLSFELWIADLSTEPDAVEIDCLSPNERSRAERFVFPRDRRRFLAAHCVLRQLLADRCGRLPPSLQFGEGQFGKPFLIDSVPCAFNLSHSGDFALIGISPDTEIGVDMEVVHHIPDAPALAERNFTFAERAALADATLDQRDVAFLLGWTRKEACLKALGSGLSIGPETFETGLNMEPRIVQIATASGIAAVKVCSFRRDPGLVCSLAQVVLHV